MHNYLSRTSTKDKLIGNNSLLENSPDNCSQHDAPGLFRIPTEVLTHCTSFLDPQSLLSLGKCSKQLQDHIKDENTWHRAFACYFFNLNPEMELSKTTRGLMMRRTEPTWKREFIMKLKFIRRYEKSRNSVVAHIPDFSTVSCMYMMADNCSLLTGSLQYGIVARSHPLTGKIKKGYLTASSPLLGIGNPNADFSPNISSLLLGQTTSPNGAAVLWGFHSGEVAFTYATRVMMDGARAQTRYLRCAVEDEHSRAVTATLQLADHLWATGDALGRVKVWEGDSKRFRCLWTSRENKGVPCVKLVAHVGPHKSGVLIACFAEGSTLICRGFATDLLSPLNFQMIQETTIPPPPPSTSACDSDTSASAYPILLFIDSASTSRALNYAVCHRPNKDPHFTRVFLDMAHSVLGVNEVRYEDGPLGCLLSLACSFTVISGERSFVLGGDDMGNVCVWSWEEKPPSSSVSSMKRWEAHSDGSVVAIEIGDVVIATGSSGGTVTLHSALTCCPLRTFSPHASKIGPAPYVSQILLRRDVLVWSAGSKVYCWRLGDISKDIRRHSQRKERIIARGASKKGLDLVELKAEIAESTFSLEQERQRALQTSTNYRDHRRALDDLGLDESGAVEYALMLSRDEAVTQNMNSNIEIMDEDIFFDSHSAHPTSSQDDASFSASFSASLTPTSTCTSPSGSLPSSICGTVRLQWANSDKKVPVPPHTRPDSIEAGKSEGGSSSFSLRTSPARSHSPTGGGNLSVAPHNTSELNWSRLFEPDRAPSSESNTGLLPDFPNTTHETPLGASEELDEDLKYALALSLAEAQSRGV